MSLLNPTPQQKLLIGAFAGLGAATLAGLAYVRGRQAQAIEAAARELYDATLARHALDQERFDADILQVRKAMLDEAQPVLSAGLPVLRRYAIGSADIASCPLPEPLRFIRTLPPLPSPKPRQPYRCPAVTAQQEAWLLTPRTLPGEGFSAAWKDLAMRGGAVALSRSQGAVDGAEARLTAAQAMRSEVAGLQAKLNTVAAEMVDTVRRAKDSVPQIRRYVAVVRDGYLVPAERIAAIRAGRPELGADEERAVLNLAAALNALSDFTHQEMRL